MINSRIDDLLSHQGLLPTDPVTGADPGAAAHHRWQAAHHREQAVRHAELARLSEHLAWLEWAGG